MKWPKRAATSVAVRAAGLCNASEAAAFIVEHLCPTDELLRDVADKVGQRVRYAIRTGKLEVNDLEQVRFDDLIDWSSTVLEWADAVSPFLQIRAAVGNATMAPFCNAVVAQAMPTEPSAMLEALSAAYKQIHSLEQAAKLNDDELARLRPLGIKKELRTFRASAARRKGGRGHTS